ncbi:MAG: hypothetical protein II932_02870 [Treponema sp.]|nr:hypothetical protein [Treponema sp.]
MGDIYDSAFRTMVNDCSKLMLPLINEMFGEHYTGSEEIDFLPNEHFISQQDEVIRTLASKYANVMQGVDTIMRGPIIETKAKKAWNAGMQKGMQPGMFSAYFDLIQSGMLSMKDAASKLGMSEADLSRKFSLLALN